MKKDHLAVYDHGEDRIWVIVRARTKEEIINKLPELTVVEKHPEWMTDELYDKMRERYKDIDDEPTGWTAELVKNRKQS